MQRIYIHEALEPLLTFSEGPIYHQFTRVLRSRIGDEISFFNHEEIEWKYAIRDITKRTIEFERIELIQGREEIGRSVTLFQALPNKLEKLEYILEKGVEVGILRFIIFRSDYSQKLILSEQKQERLRSITKEAVEQCGGRRLPEIIFTDIPEKYLGSSPSITLDTIGAPIKLTQMPQNQEIQLWVGPEGGWSEKERNKMKENGFIFVRFGDRVFRTETTGVIVGFAFLNQ